MSAPGWVKSRWRTWWERPWEIPRGRHRAVRFKRALRHHGLLTPHFAKAEWASRPDGCGCPSGPPKGVKLVRLQELAVITERVRHELGDRPIGNASAYRNPCHNGCVPGSASKSEHMSGRAFDPTPVAGVSRDQFNRAFTKHFAKGGIGTDGATGYIRHVDTGAARRWTY
jgi:hypothetical protein